MSIERRQLILSSAAFALAASTGRSIAAPDPGVLRAVWLQGNPVQARGSAPGPFNGPAVDVAEAIARRAGRKLEMIPVAGVEPLLARVRDGTADIGFIAFDPARSAGLSFTPPYLMSLNRFVVLASSPITTADQVDQPRVRVGAILSDAGGLFLQRTLRNGVLTPVASVEAAIPQLEAGAVDVLAANGQRLADLAKTRPDLRILPGSFFGVPQTVAVRQGQEGLLRTASAAVTDMLGSGAMAASIKRWELTGAEPAPIPAKLVTAAEAARSLAPSGKIRVAINLGNTVLAQKDAKTGRLGGVSVVLAKALAARLKLPYELIPYQAAGMVFDALDKGEWDLAFLAVEPERAVKIDFSPPYVSIDGTYLVHKDSPFQKVADLDKPGVRIAVARGAAYDLYLSRNLKNAELKRTTTSPAAVEMFIADKLEAAAGVRQFLLDASRGKPDLRVIGDRYSRIDQAAAVPRGHEAAAAYIKLFLEEMKASGEVRRALDATGQDGAVVAKSG
jgi:polar amino acid transport system substrate-binding protein